MKTKEAMTGTLCEAINRSISHTEIVHVKIEADDIEPSSEDMAWRLRVTVSECCGNDDEMADDIAAHERAIEQNPGY